MNVCRPAHVPFAVLNVKNDSDAKTRAELFARGSRASLPVKESDTMLRRLSLLLFILAPGCQAHPKAAAPPPAATARAAAPSLRVGDAARPLRYARRLPLVPSDDTFSRTVDIALDLRARTSLLLLNGT